MTAAGKHLPIDAVALSDEKVWPVNGKVQDLALERRREKP